MQDPKSWASSSSVLAEPGIDPDTWQQESVTFLQSIEDGFMTLIENYSAMQEYYSNAGFDPDGDTYNRMEEVVEALHEAAEAQRQVHVAAAYYITELPDLPKFGD